MTANAQNLARHTFQAALGDGPSTEPTSLQQYLAQAARESGQPASLNMEALEHVVDAEFPFLRELVSADRVPDSASSARWEAAVRWVLSALRDWDANSANALDQLRTLLVAAHVLDVRSAGLERVATQVASEGLKTGVLLLAKRTDVGPHGFIERYSPGLLQELKSSTHQGNYEHLYHLLRNLMPEPRSDLWAAIVLLWKLEPAKLAMAVAERDEVLFSILVCFVLDDSAVQFALTVPLVAFKFVSLSFLQHAHNKGCATYDWGDLLRQLLLQVAKTPDWAGWMQALFKSPDSESLLGRALAKALVSLDERHWADFMKVLSLGYSRRTAEPVADIMASFANEAGADQAKAMWFIAFRIWDEWNYAKGEEQAYMFAPAACALDYPVVMYYSQLLAPELDAEEARLTQAEEEVEQQWFDSGSDLITERNRLLSRLRLVRQARAVAAGSAKPLPPPVLPDEDLYARTRYHYHDVQVG